MNTDTDIDVKIDTKVNRFETMIPDIIHLILRFLTCNVVMIRISCLSHFFNKNSKTFVLNYFNAGRKVLDSIIKQQVNIKSKNFRFGSIIFDEDRWIYVANLLSQRRLIFSCCNFNHQIILPNSIRELKISHCKNIDLDMMVNAMFDMITAKKILFTKLEILNGKFESRHVRSFMSMDIAVLVLKSDYDHDDNDNDVDPSLEINIEVDSNGLWSEKNILPLEKVSSALGVLVLNNFSFTERSKKLEVIKYCNLKTLDLSDCVINDDCSNNVLDGLKYCGKISSEKMLCLKNTKITNQFIKEITKRNNLANITNLDISGTQVDTNCIKYLNMLKLKKLSINKCREIKTLAELNIDTLNMLSLNHNNFDDEDLRVIIRNNSKELSSLHMCSNKNITDLSLERIFNSNTKLDRIITYGTQITNDGILKFLQGMKLSYLCSGSELPKKISTQDRVKRSRDRRQELISDKIIKSDAISLSTCFHK
jgi:hypothetical protein